MKRKFRGQCGEPAAFVKSLHVAQLRYHQAVLDLLGLHLNAAPRRLEIIDQREAACAVRFPASVREWFSIESGETLFYRNSNEDQLQELTKLGDPAESAQGYLRVATENQGVVAWYVRLGDGDDSPVYETSDEWNNDLSKRSWRKFSSTFSNFIFDMISSHRFDGWYTGMHLSAVDRPPGPDELRQLRNWFQEGPVTAKPDSKVHRFFTPTGLVTIRSTTPEQPARTEAEWTIETDSPDSLFEFGKKLWRLGTLSQTLKTESWTPESRAQGDQVLQRLHAWAGD